MKQLSMEFTHQKHRTAISSIETYHEHIKGAKENSENEIVLKAISELKEATGRMIGKMINNSVENSAVARCLNNLKKQNKIRVVIVDKCPITGKTAQFYSIKKESNE